MVTGKPPIYVSRTGEGYPPHVVLIYRDEQDRRCTRFICDCLENGTCGKITAERIARLLNADRADKNDQPMEQLQLGTKG